MPTFQPDNIGRPVRSSFADHFDAVKREQQRDPEYRENRRQHAEQRAAGVSGGRTNFADAYQREVTSEAREDAVEAVADARDVLRRLKRADAPRAEIAEAREAWQAARQRRDELAAR